MRVIMRVIGFIVFIFLSAGSAMSQVLVRTYYDKGEAQIKEEFYIKSNNDAILDGPYISYYENGVVKSEGEFRKNISSGIWTYFFENGKPRMRGEVREGTNFGVWTYYYETGVKKMEGLIVDGKREGPWILYYKNQSKQSEGPFVSDHKSGTWTHYFSSGGIKAKEVFTGSTSQYTEYYKSGEVKMSGQKEKGYKEGHWSFYYEDGNLKAKGDFTRGKKSGSWRHFNTFGTVEAEGQYVNDQPEGLWLYYHIDGTVIAEGRLSQGNRDGKWRMYYNDGTIKGVGEYANGTGEYREYYKDGSLKIRGMIQQGKNDGKWQYFYESGELEGDCVFRNGEGNYVGYYTTGQVKMKGKIKDDLKVGIWEFYELDGELAGYYKPHYEEGEATFFLADDMKEQQELSEKRRAKRGTFVYKKKKESYFSPKINEYRAYIIGYNPVAPLFNSFPLSLEYYMEERLGYELLLQYLRDPFFKSSTAINDGQLLSEGLSVSARQKFYHEETKIGVPYFGHELRFTRLSHTANIAGSLLNGAIENKYEYALMVGVRYFKNRRENGFTMDGFAGFAAGYRDFNQTYVPADPGSDPFSGLNSNNFAYSIRLGVNLGFVLGNRPK